MKKVEAILACTASGLIGSGDAIPWHHKGDLRRFFRLTKNQALIMGVKTLHGIAKQYTTPGAVILPNRTIFIAGDIRSPDKHFIDEVTGLIESTGAVLDRSRVYGLPLITPASDINFALRNIKSDQKLFIAGGASIYKRFMPFCDSAQLTLMHGVNDAVIDRPVFYPDIDKLLNLGHFFTRQAKFEGEEVEGDLMATYLTLDFTP